MKEKKQLTKAETQVMNVLWSLPKGQGRSAEIMERMPEPKPALTTLLTFLKILNTKGYVRYKKENGRLMYTPSVSKENYAKVYLTPVKSVFFDDDIVKTINFILDSEALTPEQAQAIADKAMSRIQNA